MTREYCTYFDHRYAARGLAMIRSLRGHDPGVRVWALCLDDEAQRLLNALQEPGVVSIDLANFEAGDIRLQAAKADGRSIMEYYFTCTASLVAYVIEHAKNAEWVTYLDSDLWFFSPPEQIYGEARSASVIITPHRFPADKQFRNVYGIYNVGWVSFRRTPDGLACLNWWRDRTLEWCRDVVDEANDRFADQRYLDRFPKLFAGVHSVAHSGANLAPWNIAGHSISLDGSKVLVDGGPLLFFHFHGLKRLGESRYLTSHGVYGADLSATVREYIYRPYLRKSRSIERELRPYLTHPVQGTIRHGAGRGFAKRLARGLKERAKTIYGITQGLTIRLDQSDD